MSIPRISVLIFIFSVVGFDLLDNPQKIWVSGASIVLMVLSIIWSQTKKVSQLNYAIFGLLIIIFSWIISFLLYSDSLSQRPPELSTAIRHASTFIMILFMFSCYQYFSKEFIFLVSITLLIEIFLYSFFGNPVILNGSSRAQPIAGGLHTTGYILCSLFIIFFLLWRQAYLSGFVTIFILSLCAYLIFGNGVRTPIIALTSFIFFYQFSNIAKAKNKIIYIYLLTYVSILCFMIVFPYLRLDNINSISSGRIANYTERIYILSKRDILTFLFGTGPGTDLIVTEAWWWDEKDSHSDMLKYFWEAGFSGIIGISVFFYYSAKRFEQALVPLLAAVLSSALISNGFISRPNAMIVLILAGALMLQEKARTASNTSGKQNVPKNRSNKKGKGDANDTKMGGSYD